METSSLPRTPSMDPAIVQIRLREAAHRILGDDAGLARLGGQLLRPRFALLGTPRKRHAASREAVLAGGLAIQLAHEASLLHDDVVDGAERRRNEPAGPAEDGTAAALIAGDRLLTLAYRAAGAASPAFAGRFADAVDRTVAGEARQGRLRGRILQLPEYRAVVGDKSGALFGLALATDPLVSGTEPGAVDAAYELGVRVGSLYQMVDDLLDYCPALDRGKPALTDFRQEKWTLPLAEVHDPAPFQRSEAEILRRLHIGHRDGENETPMERTLAFLEAEAGAVTDALERRVGTPPPLVREIRRWLDRAREGVELQRAVLEDRDRDREVRERARAVGSPEDWPRFFGRHSRSFHFAARLFPADIRERIAGIYAFCRFTDDLVDGADASTPARREEVRARLRAWRSLVERSHAGATTDVPLLDRVVRGAGQRGIPLHYLEALLDGVEMDLDPPEHPDLESLRRYTYRVASVVGGWITEELGVRDPGILDRAFALGHAMQLTNILRDVGEDLRGGRLYLPLDGMAAHGIRRGDLEAAARGLAPKPEGYAALLEELMAHADEAYRFSRSGLPALPIRARAAVATAAEVYRGIHREIRRDGYDSLTRRAFTSSGTKIQLGARALLRLLKDPSGGTLPTRETLPPRRRFPPTSVSTIPEGAP